MTSVEVTSVEESVYLMFKDAEVQLSTRQAFDLVTQLLVHIDCARGYGEAKRGEVADPRHRRTRGPNRRKSE